MMFKGRCGKKNYKFIYVLRSIFPCIIFSSTLFVIPTTLTGFTTLFSKLLEHFGVPVVVLVGPVVARVCLHVS